MKHFMNRRNKAVIAVAAALALSAGIGMAAYGQWSSQGAQVLATSAPGTVSYSSGNVTLDASNVSQGYFSVMYSGSNSKIKIQITRASGTTYTYDVNARNVYEVFPVSEGNGTYKIQVFENIQGTTYVQVFSKEVSVSLDNEFLPFLYPNQYVNFSKDSKVTAKAKELAVGCADEMAVVTNVYNYVIDNISYDYSKAANVQSGYLPSVDKVLDEKKGICFDYAAVMASMLRSQSIPTKLVVGYTGQQYHAWINVYSEESGWVDGVIQFDGVQWKLMDPTFASSGKNDPNITSYITNQSNYQAKFLY